MRDIIKITVPLFIICLVTALCLSFVNSMTKGPIEQRAKDDAEQKKIEVLKDAQSFEEIKDLSAAGANSIISSASRGIRDGKTAGYVFTILPKGYGGEMNITVGIDAAGNITGVKLGDNKETPGLGTKAGEAPFITQFNLKKISEKLDLVKKPPVGNQIQAISGATISSRAVTGAVQAAADCAQAMMKKEAVQ